MRITTPGQVKLLSTDHPLVLGGTADERFQVSVLEDDIVRVQHFPNGQTRLNRTWMVADRRGDVPREGRRRDDLSPFSLPSFEVEANDAEIRLKTRQMICTITTGDLRLEWANAEGYTFAADLRRRAYEYDKAGRTIFHYMERRPTEHYYGFGERSGEIDKHGRRMRMQNVDAMGYNAETSDPLYKHFPFYITLVPELNIAYGLFYDNLATTTFDMGQEISAFHGFYRYYQAEDGDLDYYMIYGPTVAEVVEKYTRLVGAMILPPRWSLGYMGSTMTYTEAADAQEQLKRFVDLCQEHAIPCDLFHLSSGYTTGEDGTRYVFNWNYSRVPDPKGMVDYFHQAGIRLAANIKPWLLNSHPRYEEFRAQDGFIKAAELDSPQVNAFWSGGAFQSAEGSYFDFTSEAGYAWWKARVTDALLDFGIDSTWNDNNEFEIWDDGARCAGFGEEMPISLARPLQTLLMVRASYEAQLAARPGQRPYLISRAGCPGVQRYAQSWSGDNATSWHSLRYNIPMGLGMSLSGLPNTGHDVGGFYGPQPDPELFVRWVQNGVFHPRFTIHSYNTDGTVNEPWMHPEVQPIIREWFEFRYRLIPYLYTLIFQAARGGQPIIRPMVYAFQDDARCRTESFDFMLGDDLLVASVLEPGARSRSVYLPDGMWCDFYTGQWHAGKQVIEIETPLERTGLLVRAGGIIPMGKVMRHVGEQPDDVRQVYVFPHPQNNETPPPDPLPVHGEGEIGSEYSPLNTRFHNGSTGSFTLVEDDGESLDYQSGGYTEVVITCTVEADGIILDAKLGHAGYRLPYAGMECILPLSEQRPIINVKGDQWTDEVGRRHIWLPIG